MFIFDKHKNLGTFESILQTDILYICLPTNYDSSKKEYNMMEIDSTLEQLCINSYQGIILIKSTLLPDYCIDVNNKYPNLSIVHNPEFLSAATAVNDFANQQHIILGTTIQSKDKIIFVENFYKNIFPLATISIVDSNSASLVKLACNSFYAVKIQYFTEIYLLCNKLNIDYNKVKDLMIKNNWINSMHTSVPGHDNNISFGGACLPKDINALNEYMIKLNIMNDVINSTTIEQKKMRRNI